MRDGDEESENGICALSPRLTKTLYFSNKTKISVASLLSTKEPRPNLLKNM